MLGIHISKTDLGFYLALRFNFVLLTAGFCVGASTKAE